MATSVVEMHGKQEEQAPRVEIVRVIKASRQQVFDAWTRPEMIRQWFGPGGMTVPDAEVDVRTEGRYGIAMQGAMEPGGVERTGRIEGRYTRVEPYNVLAFTWSATWAPGEESQVTITLRDVEGGTEMKLVHDGLRPDGSCGGYAKGWSSMFDNLQRLLKEN